MASLVAAEAVVEAPEDREPAIQETEEMPEQVVILEIVETPGRMEIPELVVVREMEKSSQVNMSAAR